MEDYSAEYSDKSFWEKVKEFAIRAGKEIIEKALVLSSCMPQPVDSGGPPTSLPLTGALCWLRAR